MYVTTREGQRQWYIKWKGYAPKYNSWIEATDVVYYYYYYYDETDDESIDDDRYMLLISNANKQGKPNLFTNTLVTEIDGTDKEIALIKANLPNCWHSTSAASVKDHAFILKAPAAMALSASWLAILDETNTTTNFSPFGSNGIIGVTPTAAYNTIRDYLDKSSIAATVQLLAKLPYHFQAPGFINVPHSTTRGYLTPPKIIKLPGFPGSLPQKTYAIQILVNDKTLRAINIVPQQMNASKQFWMENQELKPITSQTPSSAPVYYQISTQNEDIILDLADSPKLHRTPTDRIFQTFYVYKHYGNPVCG